MKKLALTAAIVCSTNLYANGDELDARIAFQGDWSGVTLDYKKSAPTYIDNTKNAYYQGTVIYLSGGSNSFDYSHTLIGLSYGVSDKLNDQFNWFGQLGLGYVSNSAEFDFMGSNSSHTESGIELLGKIGVTSSLNEKVDYKAYVAMEDGTVLGISAQYKQSQQLELVAGIETHSDSRLSVGVNYHF